MKKKIVTNQNNELQKKGLPRRFREKHKKELIGFTVGGLLIGGTVFVVCQLVNGRKINLLTSENESLKLRIKELVEENGKLSSCWESAKKLFEKNLTGDMLAPHEIGTISGGSAQVVNKDLVDLGLQTKASNGQGYVLTSLGKILGVENCGTTPWNWTYNNIKFDSSVLRYKLSPEKFELLMKQKPNIDPIEWHVA